MNKLSMPCGALTILFKRQRIALGVFLAVVIAGIAYLIFAEQKYESVAELVVRFGTRSIPDINHAPTTELTPSDRREIVLSHAAILGSPDLAQATIKAFGVENIYPEIVSNPPSRWSVMDEAVRKFSDNLWVGVGTQDNIISVSFLHPDKVLARDIVKKLIDLYVAQQSAVYHDPHTDFLKHEVQQAADHLSAAQTAFQDFKEKWHINDYDGEVTELLTRRGDADASLRQAQANLDQAQNRRGDLEKLMHSVPKTLPEPASGEKFKSLDDAQTRLADLRNKRSQMLATYSANSSAMISLEAGIADAEAEVRTRQNELEQRSSSNVNTVYQTLQTDYLRTVADAESNAEPVRVLTAQINEIDHRLNDLRDVRGTFSDLGREQQLAEDLYRSLSTQYEDARVNESLNQERISSVAVISQPSLPYKTARPRRLVTLLATLCAGVILAVGSALLIESLDDRFTTADQLALQLAVPVLATFDYRRRSLPRPLTVQGRME
ncbi:MAG: hypothetical protein EPO08_11895 [Rhodospirillaceae bacterium]|nr:MAG: hypothetical protein EPO08_11895 [Rhodospirillaceae bacterium]